MPTNTPTKPKTQPSPELLSLSGLLVVLLVTNVWFLSEALTYW